MRQLKVSLIIVCFTIILNNQLYAQTESRFEVIKEMQFISSAGTGKLGVLTYDGVEIDSINMSYDLEYLGGDSVFYQKITLRKLDKTAARRMPKNTIAASEGDYFLYCDSTKIPLGDLLPKINRYSKPTVIGNYILYWGFDDNFKKVYAVRVKKSLKHANKKFLTNKNVAQDYTNVLKPIQTKNKEYLFYGEKVIWGFNEDFYMTTQSLR